MLRTKHSLHRGNQRGVSDSTIEYITQNGREFRKQGHYFYCLENAKNKDRAYRNIVVILTPDYVVKTVYFNPNPVRHLEKKMKLNKKGSVAIYA